MQGTRGAIRSGGDMEPKPLDGIPPTQEPLARFSGVVKVGADGVARMSSSTFRPSTAPCGSWRSPGRRTASAAHRADVIVRDPVVLAGTLPRFLSVGDRSRFFMQIDNVEGSRGDYTLDLDMSGPVIVSADALALHRQARRQSQGAGRQFRSRPEGRARPSIDATLHGPDLAPITQNFTIAIQPGTGALARRVVRPLDPGGRLTVSQRSRGGYLQGTGDRLGVGLAARQPRCAGPAAGARPLSLRLHGAGRQPSAAAALRQQARRGGKPSRSMIKRTSACAPRSSVFWRGRIPTARLACGRSAATISGSMPTRPTS